MDDVVIRIRVAVLEFGYAARHLVLDILKIISSLDLSAIRVPGFGHRTINALATHVCSNAAGVQQGGSHALVVATGRRSPRYTRNPCTMTPSASSANAIKQTKAGGTPIWM